MQLAYKGLKSASFLQHKYVRWLLSILKSRKQQINNVTLSSFFFDRSSNALSFSCAAFFLSLSIFFSSSSFLSLARSMAVDTSWLRSWRLWRHTSSSSSPFLPGLADGAVGPLTGPAGPPGLGGWPGNGARLNHNQFINFKGKFQIFTPNGQRLKSIKWSDTITETVIFNNNIQSLDSIHRNIIKFLGILAFWLADKHI